MLAARVYGCTVGLLLVPVWRAECEFSDVQWLIHKFICFTCLVGRFGGRSTPRTDDKYAPGMTFVFAPLEIVEQLADLLERQRPSKETDRVDH